MTTNKQTNKKQCSWCEGAVYRHHLLQVLLNATFEHDLRPLSRFISVVRGCGHFDRDEPDGARGQTLQLRAGVLLKPAGPGGSAGLSKVQILKLLKLN